MSQRTYSISAITAYAVDSKNTHRGIGKDGKIPWKLSEDMKMFSERTMSPSSNSMFPIVVMGRKTYESLRSPLPRRMNIVVTSTPDKFDTKPLLSFCSLADLESTIQFLVKTERAANHVYIIGGSELYQYAIDVLEVDDIFVTEIYSDVECDTFFPVNLDTDTHYGVEKASAILKSKTGDLWYRFMTYKRGYKCMCNPGESRYLDLMHTIRQSDQRRDRTGVGTLSVFGKMLEYDINESFPLGTTRRPFFRAIFEELMLYLRGQTNSHILSSKGIHIWDGNTSRAFLDSRGLTSYAEGDMGSTYGFNFRHFGASYTDCDADYSGQGADQLAELVDLLKTDPFSRRLIINLWNPVGNKGTALPSCLCMYQFYVRPQGTLTFLDLQIYIRSSDYFLANNWNTCTGALFVYLLCHTSGLTHFTPGKLTVCIGDAHIYKSHLDQVDMLLKRRPLPPPRLVVNQMRGRIEDFEFTDLKLIGYRSLPAIKAEMAV